MSAVRIGIVGLGNIGQQHAKLLSGGGVEGAELAAVCARGDGSGAPFGVPYGVPCFTDPEALFDSGLVDAVLIATPTQTHPEIGRAALKRGLHVLMEKPLAMSADQAWDLVSAAPERVQFAVMLNQRFHPAYARIKTILEEGRLGALQRFAWTMTGWYRPDVYYKVSKWRGTWPGEGGGLLINQCIHNLDVLQWLVGLPGGVFAVAGFGRYHEIEVEDEVTATLRFETASPAPSPPRAVRRLASINSISLAISAPCGSTVTGFACTPRRRACPTIARTRTRCLACRNSRNSRFSRPSPWTNMRRCCGTS